jgi:hypothetical protein
VEFDAVGASDVVICIGNLAFLRRPVAPWIARKPVDPLNLRVIQQGVLLDIEETGEDGNEADCERPTAPQKRKEKSVYERD